MLFFASTPAIAAVIVDFGASSVIVNEDSGTVSIPLAIQDDQCFFGECYDQISVSYSVTGEGYTDPNNGSIVLSQITGQNLVLNVINDPATGADKSFTISLSSCQPLSNGNPDTFPSCVPGNASSTSVTVRDVTNIISVVNSSYSVNEADGTVTVSVSRTGDLANPVSVSYSTADGSAVVGQDYSAVSGQLSWAAGVGGAQTVVIPIVNDTLVEDQESFTFTLSNPTGNAQLGQSTASITIASDDSPGTIALDATAYSVNEADGTVTISVSRSGGVAGPVTVSYSTSNGTA
ncbi:MAG: Calx-beta domain-containing protein, partial [Methylomonas sp.]|nr:Calx-beta domain-containing protein [Methylomonas sp.]